MRVIKPQTAKMILKYFSAVYDRPHLTYEYVINQMDRSSRQEICMARWFDVKIGYTLSNQWILKSYGYREEAIIDEFLKFVRKFGKVAVLNRDNPTSLEHEYGFVQKLG